jgi:hypothetical protein
LPGLLAIKKNNNDQITKAKSTDSKTTKIGVILTVSEKSPGETSDQNLWRVDWLADQNNRCGMSQVGLLNGLANHKAQINTRHKVCQLMLEKQKRSRGRNRRLYADFPSFLHVDGADSVKTDARWTMTFNWR